MTTTEAIFKHKDESIGPFYFDPLTLISIISQIQVASRHPKNTGESQQVAMRAAKEMQKHLVEIIPELNTIIEMGFDPKFDM